MDLESRRLLGYHFHPHLKSVLVYSGDALAEPLRHLDRLRSDVRDGRFKPNTSRSCFDPRGVDERQPATQALNTATIEPLFHIRTWVAHLTDPVRFQRLRCGRFVGPNYVRCPCRPEDIVHKCTH
eukprot:959626-Amphidinium_carterae.1